MTNDSFFFEITDALSSVSTRNICTTTGFACPCWLHFWHVLVESPWPPPSPVWTCPCSRGLLWQQGPPHAASCPQVSRIPSFVFSCPCPRYTLHDADVLTIHHTQPLTASWACIHARAFYHIHVLLSFQNTLELLPP